MMESRERSDLSRCVKRRASRRSTGLTELHQQVLRLLAAADKPLQTADIRKLARLSTIEAQDACMKLRDAQLVSRSVRVVQVIVQTRLIRQRRAFWTLAQQGAQALARLSEDSGAHEPAQSHQ